MKLRVITEFVGDFLVELNEENPNTVRALLEALPIESSAKLWGEEIYFTVPFNAGKENASETVELGAFAFWPEGPALCLFFGKTPMSNENQIKPASPVNVIGKIKNSVKKLKKVKEGEKITVKKAQS